jgi:hypothetical protein
MSCIMWLGVGQIKEMGLVYGKGRDFSLFPCLQTVYEAYAAFTQWVLGDLTLTTQLHLVPMLGMCGNMCTSSHVSL